MKHIENRLRKFVLDVLCDGPVKGTLLFTEVSVHLYTNFPENRDYDIIEFVNQLVKEGEILELEYVLPTMSYRTKSMYFPKGTNLHISKG